MRLATTKAVTDAVSRYFIKKKFSVHREFGVGRRGKYRMDVLALNMKGQMVSLWAFVLRYSRGGNSEMVDNWFGLKLHSYEKTY